MPRKPLSIGACNQILKDVGMGAHFSYDLQGATLNGEEFIAEDTEEACFYLYLLSNLEEVVDLEVREAFYIMKMPSSHIIMSKEKPVKEIILAINALGPIVTDYQIKSIYI